MPRRGLIALSLATMLVAGAPTRAFTRAEDRTARSCDAGMASARIRALFDALGDGDVARVAELFPDADSWKFRRAADGSVVSRDGSIAIEPAPRAADKVADAVERRDWERVISMFPAAGGWYFDMGQTFAQVVEGTSPIGMLPGAHRPERLRPIVDEFRGTKIELVGPVLGPVAGRANSRSAAVSAAGTVEAHTYNPGSVRWRAASDELRSDKIASIEGVAKMSLYCPSGRFQRVLLTPSRAVGETGTAL